MRAYRVARSHSGRVRLAKIALPAVGALAILAAGGYMWASRATPEVAVDLSGASIRSGKLIMANPKLDGFTADDKPYSVRAARAVQDLTGGNVIDLERIEATVPVDEGVNAQIQAASGKYNSERNLLDVYDSLSVETTDGRRADLRSAAIDLAAGNLTTEEPVRISVPGAVIEAARMEIENNGKRLLFESGVKLVIEPEMFNPPASDEPPAAVPGE